MWKNTVFSSIAAAVFGIGYVSCVTFHHVSRHPENNCSRFNYHNQGPNFVRFLLNTSIADFRKLDGNEKIINCDNFKENFIRGIQKGNTYWINCLSDNYSYFGRFVNDTLQNFVDFLCRNDSQENMKGYFTDEAKQCRLNIAKPLFGTCFSIFFSREKWFDYYISFYRREKRDDLCRKIIDLEPCIYQVLEQYCPQMESYHNLSKELFYRIARTCDDYKAYILVARTVGWTLLILSVLIILLIRFCPVRLWLTDIKTLTWERGKGEQLRDLRLCHLYIAISKGAWFFKNNLWRIRVITNRNSRNFNSSVLFI